MIVRLYKDLQLIIILLAQIRQMATMKVGSSLGVGGAPGAQREDDELARYLQGTVGLEEVLQRRALQRRAHL